MPRWTLRTQLTLLYAGPFLVSGVLLLSVFVLQTRESVPAGKPAQRPARSRHQCARERT